MFHQNPNKIAINVTLFSTAHSPYYTNLHLLHSNTSASIEIIFFLLQIALEILQTFPSRSSLRRASSAPLMARPSGELEIPCVHRLNQFDKSTVPLVLRSSKGRGRGIFLRLAMKSPVIKSGPISRIPISSVHILKVPPRS